MFRVSTIVDGKIEFVDISNETYEILHDGSLLRNREMEWYLLRVVREYGRLTEKNILRFIDEKWGYDGKE